MKTINKMKSWFNADDVSPADQNIVAGIRAILVLTAVLTTALTVIVAHVAFSH